MGRPVTNRLDVQTVLDHCRVDPVSDCWNWTGFIQTMGYGQIEVAGKIWLAHRLSWFVHTKRMPRRLVLHRCDNPRCVNPDHLFLGDHKANFDDMVAKGRHSGRLPPGVAKLARVRKLTDEQVRAIRLGGHNDAAFAAMFGVSVTTVGDIRRGKTKRLVV